MNALLSTCPAKCMLCCQHHQSEDAGLLTPKTRCLCGVCCEDICTCAGYLCQYWPTFGIWVMKKIGPLRAAQLKSGGSGYDFVSMVFGRARVKRD